MGIKDIQLTEEQYKEFIAFVQFKNKVERVLDVIYGIKYPLAKNGKEIKQKQRNELKYNLTELFIEGLELLGIEEINRTIDGYIYELQNEIEGVIPIEFNVKVKNIDYDMFEGIRLWEDKLKALQKDK